MRNIKIENYILKESVPSILNKLQISLTNGKLKEIRLGSDDIVVTCPHHSGGKEKVADCNIYVGENKSIPYGYTRCFACDFKGPFEKFVAECFDSSIEYAKNWLITNFGEISYEKVSIDDPIIIKSKNIKNYLDESILDSYQTWTPYLAQRRLSMEMCNNFKVRYDDKNRQVIFPIYDIHGKLKMLARRNIDNKFFHMDKHQDKEVYGLNIIQKNNIHNCIITEGPFDMLSGWTNNIPTIATLGTISDYQIAQINKSCITTLYLGFDNDTAGNNFAEIIKNKVSKRIIIIKIDLPPDKKDLNDLSVEDWQKIKEKYFKKD